MKSAFELKAIADAYNEEAANKKIISYCETELAAKLAEAAAKGKYTIDAVSPVSVIKVIDYLILHGFSANAIDMNARSFRVSWGERK